jgi:GNAT superfamily N-acetyltransferase
MEFRELSRHEIADIYGTHMQIDFPPAELKPLELLLRRYDDGIYFARGLFNEGQLLSYALFFRAEGYVLLDYFAVDAQLRGSGIGSRALTFIGEMPELRNAALLLEAEDPDFSADEADREKRLRRLNFYARGGVADTGLRSRVFGVDYRVLSPSGVSADKARLGMAALYHTLLPDEVYDANIFLK